MYIVIRHGWRMARRRGPRSEVARPTADDLTVLQFKCRIRFIWSSARCADVIMSFASLTSIRFHFYIVIYLLLSHCHCRRKHFIHNLSYFLCSFVLNSSFESTSPIKSVISTLLRFMANLVPLYFEAKLALNLYEIIAPLENLALSVMIEITLLRDITPMLK